MDEIVEDVNKDDDNLPSDECPELSAESSNSDETRNVMVTLPAGLEEEAPRSSTPQASAIAAGETTPPTDDEQGAESRQLTDLMPEEQLCSDDSDTAGFYQVSTNTSALTSQSSDSPNPSYQRGILSSSSSDDSMDSDFGRLAESSEECSDYNPSSDESGNHPLNINMSKVAVEGSICRQLHSRTTGDFGRKRKYSLYTETMMSSLSFVRRLRVVQTFDGHSGCVNALNFNSSGTWIASGSDDTKVYIWNVNTCKPYMHFNSGHEANVFQTKFMPYSNDTQIVTCSRDGKVRLAELSVTGRCRSTKKLAQHTGSAHKLAVENDSPHCLLSAGEDSVVYQIDLREKRPTSLLKKSVGRAFAYYWIDKRPHSQYEFAVGGRNKEVCVFDKRKVDNSSSDKGALKSFCPKQLTPHNSYYSKDITCAVYSYDGSEIVASYNDDDIYLFKSDSSDSDSVASYSGHRNSQTVKGVNFYGPQSEYIVSGSDCGNVYLWDKISKQCVQIQKGDDGIVNVLEPHPLYPYLAVSGLAHNFKLLMPVGDEPTDMGKFKKLVKRNKKHRRVDSLLISAALDRQIYLSAMRVHRLQRGARRNMDTDSDDDDDDGGPNVRCTTS